MEQLIREALACGERVGEAGRFTLAANHRSTRAGLRLARHAIESSVGFALFVDQLENSLLACAAAHARLYQGYDFRECTGTATRFGARFGTAISCLHLRPEWMPPEV